MRTNSTGLGIIGYGMASNLRKRLPPTTTLYVYDINPEVINRLITNYSNHGRIEAASSAKDLASKTGTMLSSLPAGPQYGKSTWTRRTGSLQRPRTRTGS